MRPQVLLFDLDDTLIDSEKAYRESLSFIGVDPDGPNYTAARAYVKSNLPKGHVSARNRLLYFKRILQKDGTGGPGNILDLMSRYEQALENNIALQWRRLERQALFEKLQGKFKLLLVTNENTRTQLLKWRAFDPEGRIFSALISSEECGVEKPAPQIFQKALEVANVPAEKCLMIGDSIKNDIEPTLRMGMATCLTKEFMKPLGAVPAQTKVVQKLGELEEWLI